MTFMAYRLSFGSNRLLVKEATDMVNMYLELSDWSKVKDQAIDENILGYETQSSLKFINEINSNVNSLESTLEVLRKKNLI